MSHYYYLVATLPALQAGSPPPLSSGSFLELASRSLSPRERAAIEAAVISSPREGVPGPCRGISSLLDGYYAWERAFRLALAKARAAMLGKALPSAPDAEPSGRSGDLVELQARSALGAATPLEGEIAVERERWAAIDSLLGFDAFTFEAVAAYRLRLQSLERLDSLKAERGEAGYREAYAAILGAANTIDLTGDLR